MVEEVCRVFVVVVECVVVIVEVVWSVCDGRGCGG